MTNGEKIISDFPYIEIKGQDEVFTTIQIDTKGSGTPIIVYTDWWNSEYKEPTTKNNKVDCKHTDCKNCVNHKYCDYESTTKNDLGVDAISRAEVNQVIEDYMDEQYHVLSDRTRERAFGANAVKARINELPSVTPQEPIKPVLEDIKAEIKRKANSGQWSDATVYGMQKAIAIIDKHISGK